MKILVLNSILYTPQKTFIPRRNDIKDTMIYNLCLGLMECGHTPVLIAAEEYKPIGAEKYDFEIIYLKSFLPGLFLPTVLPFHPSLISYLKKYRKEYDLIISSEVFSFNSLFAALWCGKKTLVWQELAVHQQKMHRLPSKIWHNAIARVWMRKVLVVPRSPIAGRFIKKYLPEVTEEFVDHGVNFSYLKPCREKKNHFITIGQLIPRKNIGNIIRKFSTYLDKYKTDIILYIAGDGELKEDLRRQVSELGKQNNILFLGQIPHEQLSNYLSNSIASLADTLQDLNMISISESIAVGTPVITNTIPYSSEFILENELGIAKEEWNEDDIQYMCLHNEKYVENCMRYKDRLSHIYSASRLIELFKSRKR